MKQTKQMPNQLCELLDRQMYQAASRLQSLEDMKGILEQASYDVSVLADIAADEIRSRNFHYARLVIKAAELLERSSV